MKKKLESWRLSYTATLAKIVLRMKLTAIIILASCLQVSARGYSQDAKVTLNLQKVPISSVLRAIERKTDYKFVYSNNFFPATLTVDVAVRDIPVSVVLNKILKNTGFTFSELDGDLIVITSAEHINKIQAIVKGRVRDAAGLPLAGVTISVENSSIQTATDNSGAFTINVPENAVLLFTAVGYAPERIAVAGKTEIDVVLTATARGMDEVVVIGYGQRKKKDLTGAVSTVSSEDISKSTAMTPELALQGNATGVFVESGGGEPGARPTVRIRGVNTFGYAEPLYVIDGVPIYEGGAGVTTGGIGDIRSPINIFSKFNPSDIESISVLKDASAAAIYGVRASNGVILITTKRGKTGKPRIEFSGSYATQNIAKTIPLLNTRQYMELAKEMYNARPDAGVSFGERFGPLYDESSSQYVGNGPTYDWVGELKNKNAPIKDYSAKVSGGTENFNYYFSAGYQKTESPLKGNNLERYSVATNIDSRISKYVRAGLTIRLIQQKGMNNTSGDLSTMMSTIPFQPIYDPNGPYGFAQAAGGSFVPNPDYDPGLLNPGAPFNFASGDPVLLWGQQTRFNIFAFQHLSEREYEMHDIIGNAFVEVEPITGLRIKGSLGGEYYFNLRKEWSNFDSWMFSQTPTNPYSNQDGLAKGRYGERQGRTHNLNKELTVNFNRNLFRDHNVDILLGAQEQVGQWFTTDLSGNVNYAERQFRAIANIPPFTQGFANLLQEDALIGYVGRLSYKYMDKYYVDGTLRYDGSSRLAPGYKWDSFASFAAAWRISSENFFPHTSFINDLKIRGGWGKLGNYQSARYYAFLSGVSLTPDYSFGSGNGDGYGTQLQGAALPNFANNTLTWEKLRTTSIGLDAVLFDNRVTFTAEYYNKTTFDIIQSVSLPPNTGIEVPADLNIGQVRNKGFEFQVGYNTQFGPVAFNAAANFTTVNNKIIKLYGGNPLGSESGRIEEGYSMFYLWGYKTGGVFQNQAEIDAWRQKYSDVSVGQSATDPGTGYVYVPGDMYFQDVYGDPKDASERYNPEPDGLINSNDRTYLGKTIPGYYYGFNVGANYKGLDLSIFFQGVGDVQKYNGIRSGLEAMNGIANQWATTLNRWTPQNPSKTMPRAVFGDPASSLRFSDRFVEDASYLRVKNIQLGYSLPKQLLNSIGFVQNFRMYIGAVNLLTFTKYTGLDPENDLIPPTRQLQVGINATF
ncbi:MAG: TonB-dependent receptor [Chitinophagaceae bacterium]|nr:TonB-dependent receptor [Chitinophagaceae bacterium]MCW5927682.1 TonB-dependent receptor [Chitinophagaceae bacterium]